MDTFEFMIDCFNPKEKSVDENKEFTYYCNHLFNQGDTFKYLSFTGIKYTEKDYDSWRETFDPDTKEYLIVKDSSKIIGLCIIMKDPFDKFEISGLIVDAEYRRKSIASRLLVKAESNAKKYGFNAVHLAVFCDNTPMLINVLKLGYKPVKIDYHKRYDGEDLLTLVKYF